MEADDWRSLVKHELKPFLVKTRQWIAWLWHGTEAELVVIGRKTLSHPKLEVFRAVRVLRAYYEDSGEDAFLMQYRFADDTSEDTILEEP